MDYSKAVLGSHILDTITYFRLLLPPTQFNGWHKEKSRNEKVLVYSKKPTENKQMDRATTPIYMASTILDNISPDDLIELIKSPNLWDRDFIETKKLATIDSDTYVTYTALNAKADFATKERDFAVVEHTVINPALSVTSNTYDYISFSIDSALAPIIKDRYREKPTLSAWRVQKVAPSPTSSLRTEVTFVYQCNLKGAVKHSELKNFLTRRVYINISALRHYLEKNHSIPLSVLSSVDRKGSIASSSKSKSISVKSTVSSPASQIPTETTTAIPPRSSPAENSKPAASRASLASTVRASAVPTVIEGKFETSAEPISIGEKIEVVTQETIDYTKLVYPKHENDEASVSALKYMKELLSKEGNWNVHSEQRGVKIMMYEEPGSNGVVVGMPTVRGDTTYSVIGDGDPVDNFFSVIMSRDARKIWDPRFDSTKLVQWINPNEAVYHSYQKGQFPVSGRDLFIHQRIFYEDDDTTFLIQTSVPHTVDHAPTTSHVRAHLYLAGWKIKKISSNKLDIKYVVHIDPKGTIPSRLMKMVSTQTPLCVAGVIDYIHSHGFPMKPLFIGNLPEQNVISSFISDQTTPSGYEFTYNFTLNRKPAYIGEGLVQLNVSDKIFQRGLEVKCDATDILDIVVDRSELNIRFYVKENINFPITSREIKVNISKRTGGGKVFNLNGSTMKFDDKFEPKNSDFKQVSTLGSIANGANTTISEQFKTVKSYSTEKNVVGNAIELKQCYSPSCRDGETEGKCYSAICPNHQTKKFSSTIFKKPASSVSSMQQKEKKVLEKNSSKKNFSVKEINVNKKKLKSYSTINFLESLTVLFWITSLVFIPIFPQYLPLLLSVKTLELTLSALLIQKIFIFVSTSAIKFNSTLSLMFGSIWFMTATFFIFNELFSFEELMELVGIICFVVVYLSCKNLNAVNTFENSTFSRFDTLQSLIGILFTFMVFYLGLEAVGNLDGLPSLIGLLNF